jgi:hypothetical protein
MAGPADWEKRMNRRLAGVVGRIFGPGSSGGCLEIHENILDAIEAKSAPVRGDRLIFPFNAIAIELSSEGDEQTDLLRAAFGDTRELAAEIEARLKERGCTEIPAIEVEVSVTEQKFAEGAFRLRFSRRERTPPRVRLTVTAGSTAGNTKTGEIDFHQALINLGRCGNVVDREGCAVRRNDVAFADVNDRINGTVSRLHAHIRFDEARGRFCLVDDFSQRGSAVVRAGKTIAVPGGDERGVVLSTGDELCLGRARVRFEILDEPNVEPHGNRGAVSRT